MKSFNIFLVLFVLLAGCKENNPQNQTAASESTASESQYFGSVFDAEGALSGDKVVMALSELQTPDSLTVSFTGKVTDVCQMKGCWIKVSLDEGEEIRVTFKDYGFFVPKDITGKEVTLHGTGFIEELSVEDQRHFAKDGGASEEEIQKITSPKVTYSFVADGVLLNE
ncbi:protein of unknown function [Muriicola jejuensis]|uniref:DUF4920 domain-containing protein n=1 Tax=Muriicola jejuensis TaxID=504488 RepID=A0A6P0UBU3_9FLAO|nr:DUF4920 domain-containing protein [Muriicola jejuensis]NER10694.1 DUF4920 domain-containing protein [Muriicola jejuensis]SMP16856.1 protein of unknown function [Muriicola jejuensis]